MIFSLTLMGRGLYQTSITTYPGNFFLSKRGFFLNNKKSKSFFLSLWHLCAHQAGCFRCNHAGEDLNWSPPNWLLWSLLYGEKENPTLLFHDLPSLNVFLYRATRQTWNWLHWTATWRWLVRSSTMTSWQMKMEFIYRCDSVLLPPVSNIFPNT